MPNIISIFVIIIILMSPAALISLSLSVFFSTSVNCRSSCRSRRAGGGRCGNSRRSGVISRIEENRDVVATDIRHGQVGFAIAIEIPNRDGARRYPTAKFVAGLKDTV